MKSLHKSGPLRLQRGVGLIEVLIAVLVLSIGLLGLASLQVRTLRNSQSALERGVAVVESHAIIDAMRANQDRAESDDFNITLTAPTPTGTTFAQQALAEWRTSLIDALGEGATGSVNCEVTACTIVIQWNDSRGTAGSATQQLVTQVQL